jgi:hypothetical protein
MHKKFVFLVLEFINSYDLASNFLDFLDHKRFSNEKFDDILDEYHRLNNKF